MLEQLHKYADHEGCYELLAGHIRHADYRDGFHGIMSSHIEAQWHRSEYPPEDMMARFLIPQERPNATENASEGWRWLRTAIGAVDRDVRAKTLFGWTSERKWGYVFWDWERLCSLGVYGANPPGIFRPVNEALVW